MLSPRPNCRAAHPYPRSDRGGEIGESRPYSPATLSKRFLSGEDEGEGAGELSQTEKLRQGNLSSHPAPAGPPDRSNIFLSMRALTSCPLAARQLPYRGLRDPTRNLCSGRAGNRPPFIKVRRDPTGNFRSPTTRYSSHMPTLTRNGNKAAPTQTPSSFIPWPMKRQRRYYRTSKPLFAGPYAVPPGLSSLTLDKASELKKRPVVIPHNLVASFETALSGVGEVVSWLDWWLATLSKFGEALPEETRSNFQRMMVSGARSLEFLGSQTTPVLANLVLLRRDSLLSDVCSMVPAEELSRLRHAPLPSSSALFPTTLLDMALSKTRAASNDALVHKALHPSRIPKRQPQQQNRASLLSAAPADRSGGSPLVPRQQQAQRGNASAASSSGGNCKGKKPFRHSLGRPGNARGGGKGSGKRQN